MIAINCCKDCVPPQRHPGCHSKCEQYAKEKLEYDKLKKKERESMNHIIKQYDFNGNTGRSQLKRYKGKK